MPNWGLVDDISSYIAYSGGWERQVGSSRQHGSGVHSTSQVGATATFRFRGTGIQVYGTVPSGSGRQRSTYTIDGGSPIQVDRECGSNAVYGDRFIERTGLAGGDHTLVVTNIGSEAVFRLDKIEWLPTDDPASETPLSPVVQRPPDQTTPTTSNAPTATPPPSTPTKTADGNDNPPDNNSPGGSTISTTRTETRIIETIISTYTSNGTPVATTVFSTSTPQSIGSESDSDVFSSLSSMVVTTTDSNGKEAVGTMIVVVSGGHTTTLDATSTVFAQNRAGDTSLSKGALGGIIAGSLVLFFIFLFLLVFLLKRIRRRRQMLEDPIHTSMGSSPYMGEVQRGGGRRVSFAPFNLTAQGNHSTQGLLSSAGPVGTSSTDLPRPSSVHKPALNGSTPDTDDLSNVSSPYSPSSSYSQNAGTLHTTVGEGIYPQNGPMTLHRRRPTLEMGGRDVCPAACVSGVFGDFRVE